MRWGYRNGFVRALARFVRDRRGNFVMAFALTIVPIMGFVAAAVDYTSAVRIKTELQDSVDASVLAAAKYFVETLDYNKLKTVGSEFFDANFDGAGVTNISYKLSYGTSTDQNTDNETTGLRLLATASAEYVPYFGGFVNKSSLKIARRASVNIASATIETAFVLDASGSMTAVSDDDKTKFEKSTKTAHDLLLALKQYALAMTNATGASTEFARYSLVPFAWGVNVGKDNKTAVWMDDMGLASYHHANLDWLQGNPAATESGTGWQLDSEWLTRWTVFDQTGEDWGGCVEARAHPYFLDDTKPDSLSSDTLFVPFFYPDEPSNLVSGESDYANDYAQDDIVDGVTLALDSTNSGTSSAQAVRQAWTSKYNADALEISGNLGPNRNCFNFAVTSLSNDFGLTNSQINNLNKLFSTTFSAGTSADDASTNIQQGLVWGWRVLSPDEPFTDGRESGDRHNRKVVILITDGVNSYGSNTTENLSEYGAYGFKSEDRLASTVDLSTYSTFRDVMDYLMLETCDKMKAAGIEIFVIGYGVESGGAEESLLQSCAGGDVGDRYYYGVTDANVDGSIVDIMRQLVDLRLAS